MITVAAALALQGVLPVASPAQSSPPGASGTTVAPMNEIASITLARGIKPASVFGQGEVTPTEPTTSFINTDVPYAIVKMKTLIPDSTVTMRLVDPAGTGIGITIKTPHRNDPWKNFDLVLPMYILGTDMEKNTGTWHFQVAFSDQVQKDVPFQWHEASRLVLPQIKSAVDESPLKADLHWRYGAVLALFGHDQEAIQELQSAIRLDQKYALYHITLGRLYERQGRQADAVREFEAALGLHGSAYDVVFAGWAQAHLTRLRAH